MNIAAARLKLRSRALSDTLDIAFAYCWLIRKRLVRLALVILLPSFVLGLIAADRWGWAWVWLLSVCFAGFLQAPFVVGVGNALFVTEQGAEPEQKGQPLKPIFFHLLRAGGRYTLARGAASLLLVVISPLVFTVFWLGGLYLFVPEVTLLEDAKPVTALRRSARLAKRRSTDTLLLWSTTWLAPIAAVVIGESVGQFLVRFVFQMGEPLGSLLSNGGSAFALLGFLAATPYVAAIRFLGYIDIRTRTEGWDIQLAFMEIATRSASASTALTTNARAEAGATKSAV